MFPLLQQHQLQQSIRNERKAYTIREINIAVLCFNPQKKCKLLTWFVIYVDILWFIIKKLKLHLHVDKYRFV